MFCSKFGDKTLFSHITHDNGDVRTDHTVVTVRQASSVLILYQLDIIFSSLLLPTLPHPSSRPSYSNTRTRHIPHVIINKYWFPMWLHGSSHVSPWENRLRESCLSPPHCTESMCRCLGNSFNILLCSFSNLVLNWRHHSSVFFTERPCQ